MENHISLLTTIETQSPYDFNIYLTNKTEDIIIVSDFHIAEGRDNSGNFNGTENFMTDNVFVRFVDSLDMANKTPKILVINGDFIDFLRVRSVPDSEQDFKNWQKALVKVGIEKSIQDLQDAIDKKERTYGLKTTDYKTIWKLLKCRTGHPELFDRLAQWLFDGNQVVIIKGNHDLEWYWMNVRHYLRALLAEEMTNQNDITIEEAYEKHMTDKIYFLDSALIVNDQIYIEHGHQYERMTKVIGNPTLKKDPYELNLPFGSFFNRYLINRIELAYPYVDNIRPREKILPMLFRERFPLAVETLFRHLWLTIITIQKNYYYYFFKHLAVALLVIGLPVGVVIWLFMSHVHLSSSGGAAGTFMSIIQKLSILILSYFLGRLSSILGFSVAGLSEFAQNIIKDNPQYKFVVFGHTHNAEQKQWDGHWYFNTGSWIPLFEWTSASVKLEIIYAYLQFTFDKKTGEYVPHFQRWNANSNQADSLTLITST